MRLYVLGFALAGLVLAGCSPDSAKQEAQKKLDEATAAAKKKAEETASNVVDSATKAAQEAMIKSAQKAYDEAMKLGAEAPSAALEASKKGLEMSREALDKALQPDSPQRQWITNIQRQIARIDAATMVKSLEEQTSNAIKAAQKAGQAASSNAEKARADLRAKNPEFKELDDRRLAAVKQLEDMTKQLKSSAEFYGK